MIERDEEVRDRAREHGVSEELMLTLLQARDQLVEDVRRDPRAWGFDLHAPRHSTGSRVEAELRSRSRTQGPLARSMLIGYGPLLQLVPDPLTMPDGTPIDAQLTTHASALDPSFISDLVAHLRATVQARLGEPLDRDAIEHAVREAAWDHDLDPASAAPAVLRALRGCYLG